MVGESDGDSLGAADKLGTRLGYSGGKTQQHKLMYVSGLNIG